MKENISAKENKNGKINVLLRPPQDFVLLQEALKEPSMFLRRSRIALIPADESVGDFGISGDRFGIELGAFAFDAVLKLGHESLFVKAGSYRFHKFENHFAGMAHERTFGPEETGVGRYRNDRQAEVLIKQGNARLVYRLVAGAPAGAFWKDDKRAVLLDFFLCVAEHVLHGGGTGRTVYRNHAIEILRPAENRNISQFFFEDKRGFADIVGQNVGFQRGFMFAGIDDAFLTDMFGAADFDLNAGNAAERSDQKRNKRIIPDFDGGFGRKNANQRIKAAADKKGAVADDVKEKGTDKQHGQPHDKILVLTYTYKNLLYSAKISEKVCQVVHHFFETRSE